MARRAAAALPGRSAFAGWRRTRSRSAVHLLSLGVLVGGLALTAAAALTSSVLYGRNETHLLELRVGDAGAAIAEALPAIQTPLAGAAALAAATGSSPTAFGRFMRADVGPPGSGREFVSAALWSLRAGRARLLAVVGTPPDLRSGSPQANRFFSRAVRTPLLTVAGLLGPPMRLGYEYQTAGPDGPLVYAESALPADRRAAISGASSFAGLDYALYLGAKPDPSALLATNLARLPVPGKVVSRLVPFGSDVFDLAMSSPGPLSSSFFEDLRWIVAAAGTAIAVVLALLVERLVRRREDADADADRLLRLQMLAGALGGAMSHGEVEAVLTGMAVPAAGATAGSFVLLDASGERVELATAVGYAPAVVERFSSIPADSDHPVAEAIRTGEMVLLKDARRSGAGRGEGGLSSGASTAALPLTVQGRRIGAIGLSFTAPQRFDATQVAFFEAMVRHFASALDRTRLHEETVRLLAERTQVASSLQQSLLPPRLPVIEGVGLAARYRPADTSAQVGGDFYDVFLLGDGRWLLAVGDVEGRGVEAAAVTGLVRHTLRALMLSGSPPSEALRQVNRLLLAQGGGARGTAATSRFCTVAVAVLDGAGGPSLTLSLAGHPAPLLFPASGGARPFGVEGTMLGVHDKASFSDLTVELVPGDALVLFTDGVTERHEGDRFFDEAAVARTVLGVRPREAEAIASAVEEGVRAFTTRQLHDDVAILVLTVEGP